MEYLNYRGEFAEPPIEAMLATFIAAYPHWRDRSEIAGADFEAEVTRETG